MRNVLFLGVAAGALFLLQGTFGAGPSAAQAQEAGAAVTFTDQQARQGRGVYSNCEGCHSADLAGLDAPPLTGDGFQRWFDEAPSELFNYIRDFMPADQPGSLSPTDTAAVMSYILQANGFTAGAELLPSDPAVLAGMTYPEP